MTSAPRATHSHETAPHLDAFYKRVWRVVVLYFWSEDRTWAIGLFVGLFALMITFAVLEGVGSYWQRSLYDAFQNYDRQALYYLMKLFAGLASAMIITFVVRAYVELLLKIYWRRFLTRHYVQTWLSEKRFYLLQLIPGDTDNPDQRLADDLHYITDQTLALFTTLIQALLTLAVFLGILWQVSGALTLPLGTYTLTIPGYLVWIALGYAALGTWGTGRIMRPILPLDIELERREGDLRYALARIREHSESIALLKGEPHERGLLYGFVDNLVHTTRLLIYRMLGVNLWLSFYGQISIIIPVLAIAPRYFSQRLTIGFLQQVMIAFNRVESAFSVFVNTYPTIISWKASLTRLLTFDKRLRTLHPDQGITHTTHSNKTIVIKNLILKTPEGKPILKVQNKTLNPGTSVLVQAPSGTGKSTLMRALATLWPFGEGTLTTPKDTRLFFLPQKPYLPLGTLKSALVYPHAHDCVTDETVHTVLNKVGLSGLQDALHKELFWPSVLSGGEQQRLGFARLLLARPDWAFLDEATSALHEKAEGALYAMVKEELPTLTLLSIGHRPSLVAFHKEVWQLTVS